MINITPQSYGIQTDLETDFFLLLKASLRGEAVAVQLPSRNFSKPRETGNRSEKLKARGASGSAWITLGSLTLRSFSLPSPLSPLLPEGAGMEPIIVPVIALLAWAVIRNHRDWFRGHDKCRGQVRSGFVDYNWANNPFAMSLSSPFQCRYTPNRFRNVVDEVMNFLISNFEKWKKINFFTR